MNGGYPTTRPRVPRPDCWGDVPTRVLMAVVAGNRRCRTVARAAGLGEAQTSNWLYRLRDYGLVESDRGRLRALVERVR